MEPSLDLINRTVGVDTRLDAPLHAQVRRVLRLAIEQHFDDGQRFSTESAIIAQLGVPKGTVRRALSDLTRDGLLQRQVANGSFVRKGVQHSGTTLGVF